jgi:hypothetical protein
MYDSAALPLFPKRICRTKCHNVGQREMRPQISLAKIIQTKQTPAVVLEQKRLLLCSFLLFFRSCCKFLVPPATKKSVSRNATRMQHPPTHLSLLLTACAFFFLIPASAPCFTCCSGVIHARRHNEGSGAGQPCCHEILERCRFGAVVEQDEAANWTAKWGAWHPDEGHVEVFLTALRFQRQKPKKKLLLVAWAVRAGDWQEHWQHVLREDQRGENV